MNELQIFNHPKFGGIRTITEDGNTLFCGKDVAEALGYDQPHKAIDRHCRYGTKRTVPHPQSPEKTIEMLFIHEGDIYRLQQNQSFPEQMSLKAGFLTRFYPPSAGPVATSQGRKP